MTKQKIKITVDAVVFGYEDGIVSVLLIKRKYAPFKNKWAIPGGFVLNRESLEEAVERELSEETGVKFSYLEQLYTFGDLKRDPRGRTVSVAYYGLVRSNSYQIMADSDAADVQWFPIDRVPKMAFDHKMIYNKALERLRAKITYEPVGFELLERKFPFSDLEKLYRTLLGRDIDRRNFRKKMLSLNILDELEEKAKVGVGRPGNLFKFNRKRYFKLKREGIIFEI